MLSIAIIGGGPGGYVAAIRAAQLGAEVTLIEKEHIGGVCLNEGCIPTKSLLHAAELLHHARAAVADGIKVEGVSFDWEKVQEKKSSVVDKLVAGIGGLMKTNGIRVLWGEASFENVNTLIVKLNDGGTETLTPDRIVIASGSVPAIPPIPGVKESAYCIDSTAALSLPRVPEALVIIGGGVIGVELAYAYSSFGSEVAIIEAMPEILPMMDAELSGQLRKILVKEGIAVHVGAKVTMVEDKNGAAVVQFEKKGEVLSVQCNHVLVAVGRRPETSVLNLKETGVETDGARIITNEKMQTNVSHIYAIGDCTSKTMLAHVASVQGEIAVENALGHDAVYDEKTCPSCIYTEPEFAGVGLTEQMLKESGRAYKVGKFPMMANGKSLIMGGQGTVKVLLGDTGKLLGMHILGPRATDMIAQGALCIGKDMDIKDIIDTIYAHPTISEAVREAVLAADGRAIHINNPRKRG